MSKLVLFKDLRKRSNDLLTKEFPGDKSEKKIEYKGDTSSGAFETLFVQDDKGAIIGTVKPKISMKDHNIDISGEFTTKQDLKIEVSGQDHFAKGLKAFTSINQKKGEIFGAIGTEYKHELVTLNTTVDIGKKTGPSIAIASAFGNNGLSFGASTTYLVSKSTLDGLEVVGSARFPEADISVFGRVKSGDKKDIQEVGLSYFHEINPSLAFGAEAQLNLATKNPDLVAGIQYKVHSDTIIKGKFSNAGNLGVSFQQKLNKNTKFTLSSNLDLQAVQTGKAASTVGFGVYFSA